jgi:hypothetical protein
VTLMSAVAAVAGTKTLSRVVFDRYCSNAIMHTSETTSDPGIGEGDSRGERTDRGCRCFNGLYSLGPPL